MAGCNLGIECEVGAREQADEEHLLHDRDAQPGRRARLHRADALLFSRLDLFHGYGVSRPVLWVGTLFNQHTDGGLYTPYSY